MTVIKCADKFTTMPKSVQMIGTSKLMYISCMHNMEPADTTIQQPQPLHFKEATHLFYEYKDKTSTGHGHCQTPHGSIHMPSLVSF